MSKKLQLELLLWLITMVVIILVMFPIWSEVGLQFMYHWSNVLALFIFVTFTRLIFLLRHSYMSHNNVLKAIFFLLCIPLFVYFMDRLNSFQTFIEENSYLALLSDTTGDTAVNLIKYIRYEYIFFVVAAMITVIILPIRLIVSVWRVRNRGTV